MYWLERDSIIEVQPLKLVNFITYEGMNERQREFFAKLKDDRALVPSNIDLSDPNRNGLALSRDIERKNIKCDFTVLGLAYKFSRLKTDNEIFNFAEEYGFLGCSLHCSVNGRNVEYLKYLDHGYDYSYLEDYFGYTRTDWEPIKYWRWHIRHVKNLLRLYHALAETRDKSEDAIEDAIMNVLNIREGTGRVKLVDWIDGGTFTLLKFFPTDSFPISLHELGRDILSRNLAKFMEGGINLNYQGVMKHEAYKLGFRVKEEKCTPYLLAAIYYDLWRMIRDDEPMAICKHTQCSNIFKPIKRAEYCSDACKQAAYRIRKRSGTS